MPAPARRRWAPLLLLLALPGVADTARADDARVAQLFAANCAQCHLRPGVGAPLAGAQADWKERWARGEDALLKSAVEGIRGMPPLGYCGACSEEDLRALTRMMAGVSP